MNKKRVNLFLVIAIVVLVLVILINSNNEFLRIRFDPGGPIDKDGDGSGGFGGKIGDIDDPTGPIDKDVDDDDGDFGGDITDRKNYRVFVTNDTYRPDFGGLRQGDTLCQRAANNAGLRGIWTSWLSTSDVDARDRVMDVAYYRLDRELVAENKADLLDRSIANPININEFIEERERNVYTGSFEDGTNSGNTCNDWKSDSRDFSLSGGFSGAENFQWTNFERDNCNEFIDPIAQGSLYCFEVFERDIGPIKDDVGLLASECSDGRDNDGDGRVDWPEDIGCESVEDDTESNECIEVYTAEDLDNVRNNMGACYIQGDDIDLRNYDNWEPIGPGLFGVFHGSYNGKGFKISNLRINRPSESLVGLFYASRGIIDNVYLDNAYVVGRDFVGSLVGSLDSGGEITNSYANAIVIGENKVGGLIGIGLGSAHSIENSFSLGEVRGDNDVGGLVGFGSRVDMINSYSLSYVTGTGDFGGFDVGGLVGESGTSSDSVALSYSAGYVSGSLGSVGGFMGNVVNGNRLLDSYFDIDSSGQTEACGNDDCPGVEGKATAQMKRQSTYINWDFDNVWDIVEGWSYPFLRWQNADEKLPDLRGHYSMDWVGLNEKTPDYSIYHTDLDVFGDPQEVDGVRLNALDFDGAGDYVSSEDQPWLHSDRKLTIAMWINPDGFPRTFQTLLWKGNEPDCGGGSVRCDSREFGFFLHEDGYIQFVSTSEARIGIGQRVCPSSAGSILPGQWHHVVGIIDVDTRDMKVYIDGEVAADCVYEDSNIRDTDGPLTIGAASNGAGAFEGGIDDVRVYSRILSGREIRDLANV